MKFSIAQHLKKLSSPTKELRKILAKNTTIFEHQNKKQKLQIFEALYIRNMQPKIKRIFFKPVLSIIHPRCIKEVFSDAIVFIADFGLFLHHIGSDSNPGMTLEEPSRLRDLDVLCSCLYQSKEKSG